MAALTLERGVSGEGQAAARPPGGRGGGGTADELDSEAELAAGGGGDDGNDRGDGHGGGGGGGGGDGGGGDDGDRDRTRWVTVACFSIPTQAHLARLRLENADVDCVLVDENLVSMNWLLSAAVGGIKLQVPVDQAGRAREVLGAEAMAWDESEALELAKCRVCGKGEYVAAKLPRWVLAVSVLLLGIPLLFLPRRWKCEVCGAEMEG